MKTKIDIVIVNWNAGPNLRACIRSIAQYEDGLVGKIIVVDNGSTDGSEACVEGLPGVILLRAGTNLGFGKACNLGAQESKSQYLLFLNPDTRLFADSLIVPFAYLQRSEHANIGICGIQMLDGHGHISRTCARFPSVVGFVVHALGLNKLHGLRACSHRMEEWDHSTTREVDQVIGAFFLIRRSLFDLLGGFDERFFVYYEEVDLCYRASEAGWRSVYLAGAQAFHAGGASSGQVKAERLFYSLRSRLLYGFKHFSTFRRWLLVVVTLVIEPFSRSIFSLLRGGMSDIRNTLRGYGMLCKALPAILGGKQP
jgi:GT2 family glycosyltransferase